MKEIGSCHEIILKQKSFERIRRKKTKQTENREGWLVKPVNSSFQQEREQTQEGFVACSWQDILGTFSCQDLPSHVKVAFQAGQTRVPVLRDSAQTVGDKLDDF